MSELRLGIMAAQPSVTPSWQLQACATWGVVIAAGASIAEMLHMAVSNSLAVALMLVLSLIDSMTQFHCGYPMSIEVFSLLARACRFV